jgi:hypothetical protein
MTDEPRNSVSEPGWRAEALRVSAFYPGGKGPDTSRWWEQVAGKPIETRVPHPLGNAVQDQGEVPEGVLTLTSLNSATRVDWRLGPKPMELPKGPSDLHLGALADALTGFLGRLQPWFEKTPPVKRLALGAVIFQVVKDASEGLRRLPMHVPGFNVDLQGAKDVIIQINRPRNNSTGIEGLTINRVLKWSIDEITLAAPQIGDGGFKPVAIGQGEWFLRTEFDLNTHGAYTGQIGTDKVLTLVTEMRRIALAAVEQGDKA